MEGEPISEGKGVGAGFFVETPVLRQSRHDLVLFVVCRQPREQQRIDLAMLIQRRIDRGIIAAAVTQHTLSIRTVFLIVCAAARQKPCQQQEQQPPRKYLRSCFSHYLHRLFSYSFFLLLDFKIPRSAKDISPASKIALQAIVARACVFPQLGDAYQRRDQHKPRQQNHPPLIGQQRVLGQRQQTPPRDL